jgi:hypothetical protein
VVVAVIASTHRGGVADRMTMLLLLLRRLLKT